MPIPVSSNYPLSEWFKRSQTFFLLIGLGSNKIPHSRPRLSPLDPRFYHKLVGATLEDITKSSVSSMIVVALSKVPPCAQRVQEHVPVVWRAKKRRGASSQSAFASVYSHPILP